jgi:hypothetical protein
VIQAPAVPPIDYNFARSEYPSPEALQPPKRIVPPAKKEWGSPQEAQKAEPNDKAKEAGSKAASASSQSSEPSAPPPVKLSLKTGVIAEPAKKAAAPEPPKPTSVVAAPKPAAAKPGPSADAAKPTTTVAKLQTVKEIPTSAKPAPMLAPAVTSLVASPRPGQESLDPITGKQLQPVDPPKLESFPFNPIKCAECVRILGGSPVDADREFALATLSKIKDWQRFRPAYAALRRVALSEYNTKMRSSAVEMLATAVSDHELVADTLRLSAQYDSEAAIRESAVLHLERLASMPLEGFAR